MINYNHIFDDSYSRVHMRSAELVSTFYEHFLAKSDDIKAMFAHVDMVNQKKMLSESFEYLISYHCSRRVSDRLSELALAHQKMHITSLMYDQWVESLIESVAVIDAQYNKDVEIAWRLALAPGVEFMKHFSGTATESLIPR